MKNGCQCSHPTRGGYVQPGAGIHTKSLHTVTRTVIWSSYFRQLYDVGDAAKRGPANYHCDASTNAFHKANREKEQIPKGFGLKCQTPYFFFSPPG